MKFSWFALLALCPILLPRPTSPNRHTRFATSRRIRQTRLLRRQGFQPAVAVCRMRAEVAYAHLEDSPKEWGEGWHGLWRRSADNVGYDALRNTFHVRAERRVGAGIRGTFGWAKGTFFVRTGYAVTQPLVGHADGGRKMLPWVRFAATFGVAFLSNAWYPDRIERYPPRVAARCVHARYGRHQELHLRILARSQEEAVPSQGPASRSARERTRPAPAVGGSLSAPDRSLTL